MLPLDNPHKRLRRLGLGVWLGICGFSPAQAQIYVGYQGDGVVLSNFSSPEAGLTLLMPAALPISLEDAPQAPAPDLPLPLVAAPPAMPLPAAPALPRPLHALFDRVGREHGLPAPLLAAVAAVESGFDARAQSPKGALGLMQLMPDTARQHGVRQVFSVEDNLRGGALHLRGLLRRFSGNTTLALAAYNAGEQAVRRAGDRVPDIEETRRYVPRVLAWQADYARRAQRPAR